MTDELNLEDELFLEAEEATVEVAPEASHDEEAFLKNVLGPTHAAEALAKPGSTNQEQYDKVKKHEAPKRVHVTEGGKEVRVDQRTSGKYYIKFYPGGELPKELKGEFTVEDLAHKAITNYIANK